MNSLLAGGTLDDQTLREHAFDEALMECARFMGVAWPLPPTHDLATLALGHAHQTTAPTVAPGHTGRTAWFDLDTNTTDHARSGGDLGDDSFSCTATDSGGDRTGRQDDGRDNGPGNDGAHITDVGASGLPAHGSAVGSPDADNAIIVGEVPAHAERRRRRRAGYEDGTAESTRWDQGRNNKRPCIRPTHACGDRESIGAEGDDRPASDLGSRCDRCDRCPTVGSSMCTHGMCGVHCRARQRLIGPTRGRCASVLHRVVVWMEQCAVAGCRGRTSVGCVARLCTRHCVALSPAAVACGNIPHRKAIRKSRRAAAAR
ncbi:hypothetical protein pdul_cds_739 [Pandoravirus dulcis]|uniref:Uncharacterized protein n=1 Tax=Pandoravirus dulcis TaxID=1349409 RepID=S4VRC3_9VIRU|nr:hypothetical protein pdul_cds_739 [Pandoravirus dulcis]AGO82913.1 hypothetical protein pdul_cds_739 [Pandoravirus dulcis]